MVRKRTSPGGSPCANRSKTRQTCGWATRRAPEHLVAEAIDGGGIGRVRRPQGLDRDRRAQFDVGRLVDLAHPPASK